MVLVQQTGFSPYFSMKQSKQILVGCSTRQCVGKVTTYDRCWFAMSYSCRCSNAFIPDQLLANHALALERVGDGRSQDFMSAMRGWPPDLPQANKKIADRRRHEKGSK